jgi:FlaA1/EpsC-like NDP-sugar epimerase
LAAAAWAGILSLSYRETSRVLLLTFVVLMILCAFGWRLALQAFFRMGGRHIARPKQVLIIGAGMVGKDLANKLTVKTGDRLNLVGFLDDDPQKREGDPSILDTLDHVRQVVREKNVDYIILALPRRAYERVNRLASDLHDLPVRVFVIPDYFALTLHHAGIEEFAGIPMLDLRAPALSDYQRLVKRAFDIFLTLLVLPAALPLTALIAVGIRIDSKGPLLLHQKRIGENGRLFFMHKSRRWWKTPRN